MEESGDKATKFIIKMDQEESIKYLVENLVSMREEGRTAVEEEPVSSRGSNGIVERTAKEVEGLVRRMY